MRAHRLLPCGHAACRLRDPEPAAVALLLERRRLRRLELHARGDLLDQSAAALTVHWTAAPRTTWLYACAAPPVTKTASKTPRPIWRMQSFAGAHERPRHRFHRWLGNQAVNDGAARRTPGWA